MTSPGENSIGGMVIRVDASSEIGTGHLMRCLALGQAWQDRGGAVTFLCQSIPAPLSERLSSEGFGLEPMEVPRGTAEDAQATATRAAVLGAQAIVVDGYAFRDDFMNALRAASNGTKILLIDDWGQCASFPVDLVLNQNTPPWPQTYGADGAVPLLGTDYVLLRREFREASRQGGSRDQILVTFGGSDVLGLGPSVAEALAELAPVTVVVGAAADSYEELTRLAARSPSITVLSNVTDMPSVMQRARIAVSAAGSTSWELCYFGIATVAVPVARNQQPIADFLDESGAAIRVLPGDDVAQGCASVAGRLWADHAWRDNMAARAAQLVDGAGADRVVDRLVGRGLRT